MGAPSNYPREGAGFGTARAPGVADIGRAWAIITADLGQWVLVSLVTLLIYFVFAVPVQFINAVLLGNMRGNEATGFVASSVLSMLTSIVPVTIYTALFASMALMGRRASYGEPVGIADLFATLPQLLPLMGVSLLVTLITLIGYILCIIPGLIAYALFGLATIVCADQKLPVMASLQWCLDRVRPHIWPMLGLVIVASIVAGVGVLLCGVGILITLPIYPIVLGLTYDRFVPLRPVAYANAPFPNPPAS
ncbi:MAG: hypothetical protein C4320_07615 [Armatimonadota bacterium]